MNRRRHLSLAAGAVAAGMLVVGSAALATRAPVRAPAAERAAQATLPPLVSALQGAYISVVKKVSPSVVQIETGQGLGSGVVFDPQGDIVTNAHVVGTAKRFKVTMADGAGYTGRLVGTYPANDLAVIKVDAKGLRPLPLADTSTLRVGTMVLAVGNPLGFRSSVTEGIVSGTGRTVTEPTGATLPNVVQTSAAINPGNSGGALVDLNGRLVGIPTLVAGSDLGGAANGIGFAIASSTVSDIASQLVKYGKVVNTGRGFLGVRVATLQSGGVIVQQLVAGGPAEKAGIKAGDVILSIGKTQIQSFEDLAGVLADTKPGTTVSVGVRHSDGTTATVSVTVAELPSS